jgi:hypothetical protein
MAHTKQSDIPDNYAAIETNIYKKYVHILTCSHHSVIQAKKKIFLYHFGLYHMPTPKQFQGPI